MSLQIIKQQDVLGKDFKIYGDYENPLFLAKDVAEWIEHSDVSMMLKGIDSDEKLIQALFVSGQKREMWFLTENGLYEVLMMSRKPIAKEFKKQVKIILRDIRKTGGYVNNDDMFINTYLPFADEQTKELFKSTLATVKNLNSKIEQMKPKEIFADAVSASNRSILVGELAKMLKQNGVDIGQNRLFSWLRDNGFLISRKGSDYNMPTQRAMEQSLFEIKETAVTHSDGHVTVNLTPKITGKGQQYFINKFLESVR